MSTWLYHVVINKVKNKLISWFINKYKNDDVLSLILIIHSNVEQKTT